MSSSMPTSSQAPSPSGKVAGEQVPSVVGGRAPHAGASGSGAVDGPFNILSLSNDRNGSPSGNGEGSSPTSRSGGRLRGPPPNNINVTKQLHEAFHSGNGSGIINRPPPADGASPSPPTPPSSQTSSAPVAANPTVQQQPLPETALRGPGRGCAPWPQRESAGASRGGGGGGDRANFDAQVRSAPFANNGAHQRDSVGLSERTNGAEQHVVTNNVNSTSSRREPIADNHGYPQGVAGPAAPLHSNSTDPSLASQRAPPGQWPAAGSSRHADPMAASPAAARGRLSSRPPQQNADLPLGGAAGLTAAAPVPAPSFAAGAGRPQETLPAALQAQASAANDAPRDAGDRDGGQPLPLNPAAAAVLASPHVAQTRPGDTQSAARPPPLQKLPASYQQTQGPSSTSSTQQQPPPPPPPQEAAGDPSFARPAEALSAQLMPLYKVINARYCTQRRLAAAGPKYNRGYDDKEGHYIVLPGEAILSRYTVQEVLGKGSFGTVLRCYDEKRRESVALKITRHGSNFRSQAKLELDILLKLNENPNLNHLVVKLLKVFDWQGHLVLVFELLSFNLYQLIKCTRYNGVSLELVRKFAYQLVCTLLQLEQQKPQPIIHCDIKPENILLRNQYRSGIRLIDFGSACYGDKCIHKYIQSRFYRCPEVILYLGYTTAIDRWSLGCVLVELHTGMPLFDGRTEAGQLARFEATMGPVPADMVRASCKAQKFYNALSDGTFQLKEPPQPKRTLDAVIGVTTGGPRGSRRGTQGHDEASYWEFFDFISQLLRYRAEERISCQDALRHPFLAPLYLSDQQQRHARRQQQQQQQQQQQPSLQPPPPHREAAHPAS